MEFGDFWVVSSDKILVKKALKNDSDPKKNSIFGIFETFLAIFPQKNSGNTFWQIIQEKKKILPSLEFLKYCESKTKVSAD